MNEQKPLKEEVVWLDSFAAEQLKKGASEERVRSMLVEKGLNPRVALYIVSTVSKKLITTKHGNRKSMAAMLFGSMWFVFGLFGVSGNYGTLETIFSWSAIIFGAYQFYSGISTIERE